MLSGMRDSLWGLMDSITRPRGFLTWQRPVLYKALLALQAERIEAQPEFLAVTVACESMKDFFDIIDPAKLATGPAHAHGSLGLQQRAIGHGAQLALGEDGERRLIDHRLRVGLQLGGAG